MLYTFPRSLIVQAYFLEWVIRNCRRLHREGGAGRGGRGSRQPKPIFVLFSYLHVASSVQRDDHRGSRLIILLRSGVSSAEGFLATVFSRRLRCFSWSLEMVFWLVTCTDQENLRLFMNHYYPSTVGGNAERKQLMLAKMNFWATVPKHENVLHFIGAVPSGKTIRSVEYVRE